MPRNPVPPPLFVYLNRIELHILLGTIFGRFSGQLKDVSFIQFLPHEALPKSIILSLTDKLFSQVTLLIPWLAVSDQKQIFPDKLTFARPDEQVKSILPPPSSFFCHTSNKLAL